MRVTIDNGILRIDLAGKERLWACKSCVKVPLDKVVGVYRGIPGPRILDIRAPGTFIPGVIKAGTYYTRAGKEFWYVGRGKRNYLTIELAEGKPYRRVVLGLDDGEQIARALGVPAEERADAVGSFA